MQYAGRRGDRKLILRSYGNRIRLAGGGPQRGGGESGGIVGGALEGDDIDRRLGDGDEYNNDHGTSSSAFGPPIFPSNIFGTRTSSPAFGPPAFPFAGRSARFAFGFGPPAFVFGPPAFASFACASCAFGPTAFFGFAFGSRPTAFGAFGFAFGTRSARSGSNFRMPS